MAEFYHLNCVRIVSPVNDNVCGHCLLIKEGERLVLVDTGIGLMDTMFPIERIGKELVEMVGYRFNEDLTAIRQIEKLGFDPSAVTDCVISHLDNDHIGGLADFPNATVHLGQEEYENYLSGNQRYLVTPLLHNPVIRTYAKSDFQWHGLEARKLAIDLKLSLYLIPLFGHTLGHCGVAIESQEVKLLYVADAYYMKVELTDETHPVNSLAKMRAEDNRQRLASMDKIREFVADHPEIKVFGYHDIEEFSEFMD